jgi:hypothetical protein
VEGTVNYTQRKGGNVIFIAIWALIFLGLALGYVILYWLTEGK